ncbi:MAG: PilW family protein [Pseudomonadota bacterium]
MIGRQRQPHAGGVTLIELLISMTIGLLVLAAIVHALTLSSRYLRRAEALALMQEQADVAMRYLYDDLTLSGHWGVAGRSENISGGARSSNDNPDGLALPTRCTPRFVTELQQPVMAFENPSPWGCSLEAVAGADALVTRYAQPALVDPQPGRLQVEVTPGAGRLTASGVPGAAALQQRHDYRVAGYYVAARSNLFPEQPVLRRITLGAGTAGPRFVDEEITQGIETLQVRIAADSNGDGVPDAMLDAGDPRLQLRATDGGHRYQAMAVTVSIIVRSAEPNWPNETSAAFELADLHWQPPADGYLRASASRTAMLRNAPR